MYYYSWVNAHDVIIIFLKSKTEEPLKLSSSSGMRGGKFTSVNNFSAQETASSKNRHILNFRVMVIRDSDQDSQSKFQMVALFPAAMLVTLGGTRRLHTGFCKFVQI